MALGNSENQLDIVVRVDAQGAVTVLNKLGETVGKVEGQVNKGGEAFTKYEKKVIVLNQALDVLKKGYAAVTTVADKAIDAIARGSDVDDVAKSYERLAQSAGASAQVLQRQLATATAGTISNFDLQKTAIEQFRAAMKPDEIVTVAKAARAFAEEGSDLKVEMEALTRAWEMGSDKVLKLRGINIDAAKAEEELAAKLGTTRDKLSEAGKMAAFRSSMQEALNRKIQEAGVIEDDAKDAIDQMGTAIRNWKDGLLQSLTSNEDFARGLVVIADNLQALIDGLPKATDLLADFSRGLDVVSEMTKGLTLSEAQEVVSQRASVAAALEAATARNKHKKELAQAGLMTVEATKATKENTQSLIDNNKVSADAAEIAQKRAEFIQNNIDLLERDMALAEEDSFKNALDEAEKSEEISTQFREQISNALQQGIGDGIKLGLQGGNRGDWEAAAASLGSEIGGVMGGPIGAAIGESIVSGLTQAGTGSKGNKKAFESGAALLFGASSLGISSLIADKLFPSDSAGTAARKKADAYFADLFDANRLQIIVNGQLQQLNDLVFNGSTLFGGSANISGGPSNGFLSTLAPQVQAAFEGVGAAFEQLLGVSADFQGYIAGVLANNLGNLNNLQLAVQATGVSVEELNDALEQAFLKGEMTASEFINALLSMQQIMEQGIPDAIGAVDQAWENLQSAGQRGGRALVDAIGDIGVEAKEVGLKTLPELANYLTQVLHYDAKQIAAFMDALRAQGIKTLDDLVNASAIDAAAIANNMNNALKGQAMTGQVPDGTDTAPKPSFSSGGAARSSGAQVKKENPRKQLMDDLEGLITGSTRYKDAIAALSAKKITLTQVDQVINKLMNEALPLLTKRENLERKINAAIEAGKKPSADLLARLGNINAEIEKLLNPAKSGGGAGIDIKESFLNFWERWRGDLDAIQAGIQAVTGSFRSLQDAALQAGLNGSKSFGEAWQAFQDAGPGIAGKQGAVGEQWGEVLKYGTHGGRLGLNAIRGMAQEAKELGGSTIDDLLKSMIQQGIDPQQAASFRSILENSGVTSLDQLLGGSDELLIKIGSGMEDAKIPFQETGAEVRQLLNDVQELTTGTKTITVKIVDITDPATREWLTNLGVNLSTGEAENTTTSETTYDGTVGRDPDASTNPETKTKKKKKKKKGIRVSPGVYRDPDTGQLYRA